MGTGHFVWLCVLFVNFVIFLSPVECQNDVVEYRLPTIYSPSSYSIDLKFDTNIFNGEITNFTGNSTVTFKVLETTSVVKIHGAVEVDSLILTSEKGEIFNTEYTYNKETEILTINSATALVANSNYMLSIAFTGDLDLVDMKGVYRSEYINENGTKIYLVTTQFQATHARKGFPCFDEPHYKATFSINITYPTGLLALGNTPIQTTETVE